MSANVAGRPDGEGKGRLIKPWPEFAESLRAQLTRPDLSFVLVDLVDAMCPDEDEGLIRQRAETIGESLRDGHLVLTATNDLRGYAGPRSGLDQAFRAWLRGLQVGQVVRYVDARFWIQAYFGYPLSPAEQSTLLYKLKGAVEAGRLRRLGKGRRTYVVAPSDVPMR